VAILMILEIPGGTTEMYDRVSKLVGITSDEDAPEGLVSHVAGPTGDSIVIVDVWESAEALQRFFAEGGTAAMEQAGVPPAEPRILPIHNLIQQGAGTEAGVIMIAELERFTPAEYDRLTAKMSAHAGDGSGHPAVSHVAARREGGGLVIVDVWDSPESFARLAEEQVGSADTDVELEPFEPRFVPVHNRLRGRASASVS
jgi:hypothetical protein